jgi:hypothetical protein
MADQNTFAMIRPAAAPAPARSAFGFRRDSARGAWRAQALVFTGRISANFESPMVRALFTLLALFCVAAAGWSADGPSIKFPSPDGRFALRITEPNGAESVERNIELIEKDSGKVMVDLGVTYSAHLSQTVLVWSADSKRAAYGTRNDREGETSVYFWNGSAFEEAPLPDKMPDPKIKFGQGAGGAVKNYGGAVKPLRWLKSGELELSSDLMMLSRVNDRSYTGVVVFTVAFDAQHHATVHTVGKTKTRVDE